MAATTGLYVTNSNVVDLYSVSTTPKYGVGNVVFDNGGKKRVYGKCVAAMGSIQTVQIGAAGSISTLGSTTATYIMNAPGGVAINLYAWARQRTT
jgi:hypothetical protein